MTRTKTIVLTALIVACTTPAFSEPVVIQVKDHDELNKKMCAARADVDHVFIIPADLFVDARELVCANGVYKMYRVLEAADTDDFEYYIDPPMGKETRLACDGKAGVKMKVIAVNCRPV